MSYPSIHKFVDKVRGISPNSKDFTMSAADARALQSEIVKLLLALESSKDSENNSEDKIQKIELKGGSF